ncbi:MAG: hypothetical protein AB8B55_24015 [Mariniblastus sp.]
MRTVAFSLFLMLAAVCAPAMGQSSPLEEKQKAVLAFEIRMDLVRDSELGKSLGLAEMMSKVPGGDGEEMDMSGLESVLGAVSAPATMGDAMAVSMGGAPPEFFVQLKFKDNTMVDQMIAMAKKDNGGVVERDGKTFYKPPSGGGGPDNMMMHSPKAGMLEMGTEAYLFQDTRQLMTDGLKSAWKASPKNESIRIVMDMDGAKGLIAEAVEQAKASAPDPMVGEYLGLIDNMKDISISMNVADGNLMSIFANGVNSEDAEELQGGLDSILGMAKMGGKMQVGQMQEFDPEGAKVLSQVLDSLNAKKDGDRVSVVIPKPDGFNPFLEKAVKQAMAMMPPGLRPPE